MHLPTIDSHGNDECNACSGRRSFLRDAIGAALLACGTLTLAPLRELAALSPGQNDPASPATCEPTSGTGMVRYPIPAADGVSIDKRNQVMLCRAHGTAFAFALACPHQNTALRVLPGSEGFQCPRHKSRYQPDGTFVSGRATRNMDRLPITRDGDQLVVNADVAYASDTDNAHWSAALVRL